MYKKVGVCYAQKDTATYLIEDDSNIRLKSLRGKALCNRWLTFDVAKDEIVFLGPRICKENCS